MPGRAPLSSSLGACLLILSGDRLSQARVGSCDRGLAHAVVDIDPKGQDTETHCRLTMSPGENKSPASSEPCSMHATALFSTRGNENFAALGLLCG